MDIEKLIHCLQCCARVDAHNIGCDDCWLEYCGTECQQLCGTAATALATLQSENARLRAEPKQVMRERLAAYEGTGFEPEEIGELAVKMEAARPYKVFLEDLADGRRLAVIMIAIVATKKAAPGSTSPVGGKAKNTCLL